MSTNPDELRDEGRRLFRDGSYAEAIQQMQMALDAYSAAGNTIAAAEMMNDIGVVHRIEDRLDKSAEMLEKARAAFEAAGDHSREAQTLGNLAPLYRKQGNNDKALETYTRAADIFGELKDRDREGEILMSRGLLEFDMGKRLNGLTSYELGLKMISKPTSRQKWVLNMLKIRKGIMGS